MTHKLQNHYTKKNSCTVKKVLGPTADFPTWGSGKGQRTPGNLTLEASGIWLQNCHRTGETDSWRAQTKPCAPQEPGQKQCPHRRLSQICLWVSWGLWQKHGPTVACCRVRVTEYNSVCTSPFEGDRHYLHYPYFSLASGQTTGREHSSTHQQKIGLKIYRTWPRPSEQDPVSPIVSLSHQEASISLYPSPSEGRQNENHNHRKLTKLITWTTALSNSMKLWAMLCGATQDGLVIVESSDKTWSPGEGNGKPP